MKNTALQRHFRCYNSFINKEITIIDVFIVGYFPTTIKYEREG
jgi:hypothetical protein